MGGEEVEEEEEAGASWRLNAPGFLDGCGAGAGGGDVSPADKISKTKSRASPWVLYDGREGKGGIIKKSSVEFDIL